MFGGPSIDGDTIVGGFFFQKWKGAAYVYVCPKAAGKI